MLNTVHSFDYWIFKSYFDLAIITKRSYSWVVCQESIILQAFNTKKKKTKKTTYKVFFPFKLLHGYFQQSSSMAESTLLQFFYTKQFLTTCWLRPSQPELYLPSLANSPLFYSFFLHSAIGYGTSLLASLGQLSWLCPLPAPCAPAVPFLARFYKKLRTWFYLQLFIKSINEKTYQM